MGSEKSKLTSSGDDVRRIVLAILSGVVVSLNLQSFVHTGGLFPGGIAGFTVLVQGIAQKFWSVTVPYGRLYLILNLFPILLAIFKIGRKFTIYSCISIFTVTVLTEVLPIYTITSDMLLIAVFGGVINGAAICLALAGGATTGGTDFIAIFLSERFGVDGFQCILIFNAVLLTTAGLLFGWEKALYSLIFQFASTQVIRFLNNRYKKNTLFIVTDHPKEIEACLNRDVRHGVTEMHVVGAYQGADRTMLYTVISNSELKMVLRDLHDVDPGAFINVMKTEQVSGRFYIKPND